MTLLTAFDLANGLAEFVYGAVFNRFVAERDTALALGERCLQGFELGWCEGHGVRFSAQVLAPDGQVHLSGVGQAAT